MLHCNICPASSFAPFDQDTCDRCWLNRRCRSKHKRLALSLIERVIEPMLDRHAAEGYDPTNMGLQDDAYETVLGDLIACLKRPNRKPRGYYQNSFD
jgi:hypothetical protein